MRDLCICSSLGVAGGAGRGLLLRARGLRDAKVRSDWTGEGEGPGACSSLNGSGCGLSNWTPRPS